MPAHKGEGKYRDRTWLYERYITQCMPVIEICKEAKCCPVTIYTWLDKFGIERRTQSESMHMAWERGDMDHVHSSPEFLRKQSETKKKMWAEGHYVNVHTSAETRARHSRAAKRAWAGRVYENSFGTAEFSRRMSTIARKAWASGRLLQSRKSPEYRAKISRTVKRLHKQGVYSSKEISEKKRRGMRRAWASGRFDGVFKSPTSIEAATREALDELGFEYIYQYRPEGYHRVYDFYLPKFHILIECQGEYWHSEEYHPGVTESDYKKHNWAVENGYIPIEIWGNDIREYGAKMMMVEELVGEGLV